MHGKLHSNHKMRHNKLNKLLKKLNKQHRMHNGPHNKLSKQHNKPRKILIILMHSKLQDVLNKRNKQRRMLNRPHNNSAGSQGAKPEPTAQGAKQAQQAAQQAQQAHNKLNRLNRLSEPHNKTLIVPLPKRQLKVLSKHNRMQLKLLGKRSLASQQAQQPHNRLHKIRITRRLRITQAASNKPSKQLPKQRKLLRILKAAQQRSEPWGQPQQSAQQAQQAAQQAQQAAQAAQQALNERQAPHSSSTS